MAPARNHNGPGTITTVLSAGAIILTLLQIFLGVIIASINANITRIEEQTTKHFALIEAGFVRVGEYRQLIVRLDGNFTKIDTSLKDVETHHDVLKRDLGQTYSVKDALKDMQDQIKLLQGRQYSPMPLGTQPTK